MGMLSEFFICEPGDAVRYNEEEIPFPKSDYCQYKGVGTLQVGQLFDLLRGMPLGSSLSEFHLAHEEADAGPWTIEFPHTMTAALAALNANDVAPTAIAWSQATQDELGEDAAFFEPIVRDLIELARAAQSTGKSLYLWLCL